MELTHLPHEKSVLTTPTYREGSNQILTENYLQLCCEEFIVAIRNYQTLYSTRQQQPNSSDSISFFESISEFFRPETLIHRILFSGGEIIWTPTRSIPHADQVHDQIRLAVLFYIHSHLWDLRFSPPSMLSFLADLERILERYGNRGYRAVQLEAGAIGGRMYLAAYAQRLGATGLTFFDDDVISFFSPHAKGKSAIFLLAIGKPLHRKPE